MSILHSDPNPTRWTDAPGEQFLVWSTETRDMPSALRSIAAILEADPDLVLYTLVNAPGEPSDPAAFIVQITLSRTPVVQP